MFVLDLWAIVCQSLVQEARKKKLRKIHEDVKGTAFSECKTEKATDGDKKISGLEKKKKKTDMVSHENEEFGWSPSMQDLVSKASPSVIWVTLDCPCLPF